MGLSISLICSLMGSCLSDHSPTHPVITQRRSKDHAYQGSRRNVCTVKMSKEYVGGNDLSSIPFSWYPESTVGNKAVYLPEVAL